ncbi:MAG: hypothetical protein COA99_14730 [Moraxellaceae bacterium]|nr:MAG: hypothetical protein COA99_14730 [Moraxellaceae bacterium]
MLIKRRPLCCGTQVVFFELYLHQRIISLSAGEIDTKYLSFETKYKQRGLYQGNRAAEAMILQQNCCEVTLLNTLLPRVYLIGIKAFGEGIVLR